MRRLTHGTERRGRGPARHRPPHPPHRPPRRSGDRGRCRSRRLQAARRPARVHPERCGRHGVPHGLRAHGPVQARGVARRQERVRQLARRGRLVTIYDRNANTGALTQKPRRGRMHPERRGTPAPAPSDRVRELERRRREPRRHDRSASSPAARTPWPSSRATPRHGTLTQKAGLDGCVADNERRLPRRGGDGFPYDLTVSPDGKSVYVASFSSASVDGARRRAGHGCPSRRRRTASSAA